MSIIGLLYSLLIVAFAGKAALSLLQLDLHDEPYGMKLPVYFLSGSIVISLYMLLLFSLKVPFSILSISTPVLLYIVFLIYMDYKQLAPSIALTLSYCSGMLHSVLDRKNIVRTFIFLLLSVTIATIFLQNLIIPIFIGDSYAHWFFKAKAIYVSRTIPADILTNMDFFYTRTDYPLLVPLNLAWIAICTGGWSDTITRTFFSFYFLSMTVFLYFSLKRHLDDKLALYGTFMACTVPSVLREATNGYVDINIAILTMVSAILLFNWFKDRTKLNYFLLSAIFIGGAAWTKNDGIALLIAMSLTLSAYLLSGINKGEIKPVFAASKLFAYLAMGGIVFLPFKIFISALGIKNHMISGSGQLLSFTSNLWRAPYILNQFMYEFFLNTGIWLYFWIFFILIVFFGRKQLLRSNAKYLLFFLLLYCAILFCVFMVTSLCSTVDKLKGNLAEMERLLLQIAPTAAFVLMLSFSKEKSA